jgi:hypothetical protein
MAYRCTSALAVPLAAVAVALTACNSSDPPASASNGSGSNAGSSSNPATGSGGTTGSASNSTSGSSGTSTPVPGGATGLGPLDASLPAIDCRTKGDGKTTLTLVNHCNQLLEARGSNWGGKTLASGGFVCLELGSDVETLSSLRYWGYVGEDPGGEHHTLAEFTLNTDFNDFDWFNLSHVDAHNLPMAILPVSMANCRALACPKSLLADCPTVGLYRDSHGTVTSCVSPDRNNASSPVAAYFDAACVDAYSWSGDDAQSMVACAGEDYDVVFCP